MCVLLLYLPTVCLNHTSFTSNSHHAQNFTFTCKWRSNTHTFATVTFFPCFHYSLVYIDHSSIPFRRIKPRNQTSPPLGVDILELTFLEEPGERCHSYSTKNKDASQWIYEMVKVGACSLQLLTHVQVTIRPAHNACKLNVTYIILTTDKQVLSSY